MFFPGRGKKFFAKTLLFHLHHYLTRRTEIYRGSTGLLLSADGNLYTVQCIHGHYVCRQVRKSGACPLSQLEDKQFVEKRKICNTSLHYLKAVSLGLESLLTTSFESICYLISQIIKGNERNVCSQPKCFRELFLFFFIFSICQQRSATLPV